MEKSLVSTSQTSLQLSRRRTQQPFASTTLKACPLSAVQIYRWYTGIWNIGIWTTSRTQGWYWYKAYLLNCGIGGCTVALTTRGPLQSRSTLHSTASDPSLLQQAQDQQGWETLTNRVTFSWDRRDDNVAWSRKTIASSFILLFYWPFFFIGPGHLPGLIETFIVFIYTIWDF